MELAMSTQNIRLSRVSHPRASVWAMLLLVIVCLGFGVVAEACLDEDSTIETIELSQ